MVDVAARVEPVPSYTGPIFDGDTHIYEQADSWSRYLPKQYEKDWGFNWKVGKDGQYALYIGSDRKIEVSAGYFTEDGRAPPPGRMHEWLKAMKEGKMEVDMRVPMTADMTHLAPRVKKMDEFGVEACFLYCGNMVASISYLDQIEPAKAVLHAYNRWMLDEWRFNFEDRVYSCPLVTLEDLDWACQEAEWAIKNGTRMFLMPMGPYNNKAPADPAHDRFWSILNEAHCRVVYHVSEAIYMKSHMAVWGEPMQQSRLKQSAFVWMHGYSERPVIETLSSFVFYNFFARFPNVKLLSAENGAEWVPATLVKMDKVRGMSRLGHWPCGQLKERPSAIFRRHIGVVAYPEDDLKNIIEQCDGDARFLIMGSDYPHSEGVPEPRDFLKEACTGLTEQQTRQVMYQNGKDFIAMS